MNDLYDDLKGRIERARETERKYREVLGHPRMIPEFKINCQFAEALLEKIKEHEPVAPLVAPKPNRTQFTWWYACGSCQTPIDQCDSYCRKCGKPILWTARMRWG